MERMRRDEVMRWVAGDEQAWRDGDLKRVERLFTPDAVYGRSPYMEPDVGIDAIKSFCLDDDDEVFSMRAEPVAVEGDTAVVRVEVRYGDPLRQEYRDLWVLRFAGDAAPRSTRSGRSGRAGHTRRPGPTPRRTDASTP